jgi:tetratricopeptide (TPR) repeat protein
VAAAAAFVAFALPRLDNRESSAAAPLDQQNAIVDALPTSGNSDAKAEPVAQAEPSATTPLDAGVEREAQAESLAAASLDPKKVIVHTFVTPGDATPDAKAERVAQMASDWIVQGLVQTKLVTVMPVGPFAVNGSRRRAGAGSVDASLLLEARRAGAGHMITGRYHTVSDTVLLNVQIISTRDGAVVRAIGPVRASSDAPVDGAEQLRQRVLGSLATIVDARLAHWSSVATQPMNLAAYQAFSDGLAAFFDETSGRDPNVSFRRAHALDSTFTAPLLWALFRANKATSDSIFAYLTERRSTLPPWDQGVLDFFLRKNDEEGYQAFRRVVEVAPQSEWLYMLAWTARASGRPAVAVRALEQLDPNRGWMRNWPSYWSVLASAHHDLGHYEQELRAARLGLAKFPSSRGLQQAEIGALGALNRPIELQRALASISYHSPTVGTALPFFAPVISHLRRHGQLALADTVTDRLLRELDERRPAIPEPRLSRTRVWILWHARRWDEASVIVEQQLRNNPRDTDLTGLGAQIAAWRGNRAESERLALIYKAIADSVLKPGIWADRFYSGLRARLELLSGNRSAAIGILMSAEFGRNGEGADPSFESLYGDPSFEAIWRDYRDDPDVLPVRKSSKAGGSQHGMNRR